jgi:hypothetical protein
MQIFSKSKGETLTFCCSIALVAAERRDLNSLYPYSMRRASKSLGGYVFCMAWLVRRAIDIPGFLAAMALISFVCRSKHRYG